MAGDAEPLLDPLVRHNPEVGAPGLLQVLSVRLGAVELEVPKSRAGPDVVRARQADARIPLMAVGGKVSNLLNACASRLDANVRTDMRAIHVMTGVPRVVDELTDEELMRIASGGRCRIGASRNDGDGSDGR